MNHNSKEHFTGHGLLPETGKIYEVSEVAANIKNVIEANPQLQGIWIRGETSRVTYHTSGHLYFSLKDDRSVINAVMWRTHVSRLSFEIKEGLSVLVQGNITTFSARSNYQVQVLDVIPEGVGKLQQKIEQLKIALLKEGLFDEERKKKIPHLPGCVGIVTSPTGAAFRDMVRVLKSRYPNVNILLAPCDVQGETAVKSIVRALSVITDPFWKVDVVISGRGGGSLEDLMAFNDEQVVRAIASSPIPIITGIGHEIDFTLSDFAADKRGATPSQAAEIAVPEIKVLTDKISTMTERCTNAISQKIEILAMELQKISAHRLLQKPQNYLNELHQRLDDQEDRIQRGAKGFLENYYLRLQKYDNLSQMLKNTKLFWETKYVRLVEKLEGLSPLKAISRGYSYVTNRDGKIVTEKKQVTIGDSLEVRIIDAILDCKVVSIKDLQVKG